MGKGFDAYIKTCLFDVFVYLSGKLGVGEKMPFSDLMEMAQDGFHMQGVSCEDFERNLLHLLRNETSYKADEKRKILHRL